MKTRIYSKDQKEYRDAILKKKEKEIGTVVMKPTSTSGYISNCAYWVEQYENGNVDKKRLSETVDALEGHIKSLKMILED